MASAQLRDSSDVLQLAASIGATPAHNAAVTVEFEERLAVVNVEPVVRPVLRDLQAMLSGRLAQLVKVGSPIRVRREHA